MARIFISHSWVNNAEALALRDWLVARGWDDLFLDIDPQRGLVSGQRWLDRLQESAHRCKAVLFVLSRAWLASGYCKAEFWEARKQDRPLFAVVVDDTAVAEVPAEMSGVWQLAFLTRGSAFETFSVQPPRGAWSSSGGGGRCLEPGLTAALLADTQGADALPLLGFTLERLYVEHGGDGALTQADYDALGGVQGSIEAAVAEAFADPEAAPRIPAGAAEREALLKRAFVPHLMGVNEANGEPVRRTARLSDLPEAACGLIDRLIDRRLLVVDRRAEENVIEVAHEALLRRWPTLRRWLDEERAALQTQQEVARAASAWSENACRTSSDWITHRGTRLKEAEAVARREDFAKAFEGLPRAYLDACRQAEDAVRDVEAKRLARQRAMQRRVGVLLAVVAIVTLVGGWLVLAGQRKLARQESRLIAANAQKAFEAGHYDSAMRLALVASQGTWLAPPSLEANIQLGHAAFSSPLEAQLTLTDHKVGRTTVVFSPNSTLIVSASPNGAARIWSRDRSGYWPNQS